MLLFALPDNWLSFFIMKLWLLRLKDLADNFLKINDSFVTEGGLCVLIFVLYVYYSSRDIPEINTGH